ncbi:MAG: antibiotic biosynthesis monooxygenase [Betaproteobacteria bacterium]|nr:MAG: antibiotic biosynthesis monooxygenase [Betaproteobacteria bacterium]
MNETADNAEGPITITVSRRVKPGREGDYESWSKEIISVGATFPGFLGVNVLKPARETGGEYVSIYRFDTYAHAREFQNSSQRAQLLKKLEDEDIVEGEPSIKHVTGLETWFELPEVPASATPSPHRMAIVLIGVVFVLVLGISYLLGPYMQSLPLPVRVLILVTLQVLLMTYVVMPRVTRLLKNWLYKS